MKKFAISLIALAALSTASFASQRGYDLRDSDTYFGKYSEQANKRAVCCQRICCCQRWSGSDQL